MLRKEKPCNKIARAAEQSEELRIYTYIIELIYVIFIGKNG